MQIEDFLPKYPNIHKNNLDPYDEDFYKAIFRKKEFYEKRLNPVEPKPTQPGQLMKHQEIVSRFLSSHTLYNGLLLFHIMGSGKGCSAFGTTERIRSEKSSINGVIVLAKGEGLLDNLINELVFVCTSGKYIPENYSELTQREKKIRTRKKIESFYFFDTFEKFAKKIKNIKDNSTIKNDFSNKIVIIDEVHNIRIQPEKKDSVMMYQQIHRFLHSISNSKILLLSGTPMKDRPEEIASIMNLILPLNKQLPTGKEFVEQYLQEEKDKTYSVKKGKIDTLKTYLKGRVSVLKSMQSNIEKKYIGKPIDRLKLFNIDIDKMSDFQDKIYKEAFEKDTKGNVKKEGGTGVYSDSRQAILFTFPNGSYGSKGFNKYIIKSTLRGGDDKPLYRYTMKKLLKDELLGKTDEETLEKIRKHSSKYARIIEEILKGENKSCFVYSQFVLGSGSILFSLLLELFGYRKARGREQGEGKRYILLSNSTSTKNDRTRMIQRFNQPDNKYGNIIKVVIGSRVIGEGFSLKNVQQTHIVTPHWNFSETSQAIYRAIRLNSHNDLKEAGISPVIRIYLHASEAKDICSIDLMMYLISEIKDISIKRLERILKEAAFDCALMYERNSRYGRVDGSRECEYTKCSYTCDGIDHMVLLNDELDYSTFQLYYSDNSITDIIDEIKDMFLTSFSIDLNTFLNRFETEYTGYEILTALRHLITDNIPIYNKYGFPNYLREENNIYFLVNNLSTIPNFLSSYYASTPNVIAKVNFNNVLKGIFYDRIPKIIDKLSTPTKVFSALVEILPLNVQEILIETALSTEDIVNENFRNNILTYFNPYIIQIDNIWISTLLYESENRLRCLQKGEWADCSEEFKETYKGRTADIKGELEKNPYGYYGIYIKAKEIFKIRNVTTGEMKESKDRRKITGGKRCLSWTKDELLDIISKIGIESPKDFCKKYNSKEEVITAINKKKSKIETENKTKEELCRHLYWITLSKDKLCSALKKWFEKNKLLKYE